ncbi:MAG: RNA polymerase sigma factor [bacterium]
MQGYEKASDDELIRLVKRGELKAFDALVVRYHRKVYGIASSMLKDHDAADDICQETFLRAYRALGRFREGASFFTWVYRIAVNLCLNAIRSRKRLVPVEEARETASSVGPSQEDCAERRELLEKVNKKLEVMHPKYRAALLLRVNEGLSYAEISVVLGVPKGTVMSRISRAREMLRCLMDE